MSQMLLAALRRKRMNDLAASPGEPAVEIPADKLLVTQKTKQFFLPVSELIRLTEKYLTAQ